MGDLSENEVLAILNRMDAEQRALEQFTAARQKIRDVITRYQAAVNALPSAEQRLRDLQERADTIEASVNQEGERLRAALDRDLNAVRIEHDRLVGECNAANLKLQALTVQVGDAEAAASARIQSLAIEIRTAEKRLLQATQGYETFKAAHLGA